MQIGSLSHILHTQTDSSSYLKFSRFEYRQIHIRLVLQQRTHSAHTVGSDSIMKRSCPVSLYLTIRIKNIVKSITVIVKLGKKRERKMNSASQTGSPSAYVIHCVDISALSNQEPCKSTMERCMPSLQSCFESADCAMNSLDSSTTVKGCSKTQKHLLFYLEVVLTVSLSISSSFSLNWSSSYPEQQSS